VFGGQRAKRKRIALHPAVAEELVMKAEVGGEGWERMETGWGAERMTGRRRRVNERADAWKRVKVNTGESEYQMPACLVV
jgi:hypothetical protein